MTKSRQDYSGQRIERYFSAIYDTNENTDQAKIGIETLNQNELSEALENPDLMINESKLKSINSLPEEQQKLLQEIEELKTQLVRKNQEIEEQKAILSSYNMECDRMEYALKNVVASLTLQGDESLLEKLVCNLGKTLKINLVILSEIKEEEPYHWRTMVVYKQGKLQENFAYNIQGTPCEQVYNQKAPVIYHQGVTNIYSNHSYLVENQAQSYIGFPLFNYQKKLIGSLCLIDNNPLVDQYWSMAVLKIFASQIGAELQNKQNQEILLNVKKQLESQIEDRIRQLSSANQALEIEINEKEQVKNALIESKEQYLTLVNSLQEVVFQRDLGGNWTFLNNTWTNLTGFSAKDTIGRHFSEFIHPDDRTTCLDCLHPLIENDPCRQTQVRYLTKNGDYRWMAVQKQLVYDQKGQVIGLSGTLRDITKEKKAQEALAKEQKQLYNLINSAPVAIAMFDDKMNYVAHSQQWLKELCLNQKTLVGKSHYEVFPNLPPQRIELYKRVLKGEYLTGNEDTLILPDGLKLYYKWAMNPWLTVDNQIGGMIMVIQRINELVEARNTAVENAKIKSHFLATMSHEIRTPMNGVLGMAELLLKTKLDEQQQDFVKTLYQSGKNLLTIINEILDFSKLEAGEMHLEKVNFNINNCLEEVVDILGLKAQEKDLELLTFIDYQVENLNVQGDPTRLRQILLNLVGNALKFTHEGSVIIQVALEEETENLAKVRFQVKDTGIGIAKEYQEKIFDSFCQMDASTTRKYGGTGLGLAICKQLVTIMGGEIGVESQIDQGSIFWFTVTLTKQSAPLTVTIPPKQYLKGLKLLIISHHLATQKMLESYGLMWEMVVKSATTIQEGVTYFNQEQLIGKSFDLAVIEMQYPDLDQEIFAYLTKINPELGELPCIWLTSLEQKNQVKDNLKNCYHHSLIKPIKPSRLADMLIQVAQFGRDLTRGFSNDSLGEEDLGCPLESQDLQSTLSTLEEQNQDLMRILLVEDTPTNQKVILNQLKNLGYQAQCVNNGQEALHFLENHDCDLILMDCLMPNLDGYETTRIIRSQPQGKQTIIIAMTANAMVGEREKCLKAGMDDYLSKPLELEELERVLIYWQGIAKKRSQDRKSLPLASSLITTTTIPVDLSKLDALMKGDKAFKQELFATFLEDAPCYLKDLKKALQQKDFETIVEKSHQLKGMSSMVGVLELPELAQTLERQAQAKQLENQEHLIAKMDEIVQRVENYVELESQNWL